MSHKSYGLVKFNLRSLECFNSLNDGVTFTNLFLITNTALETSSLMNADRARLSSTHRPSLQFSVHYFPVQCKENIIDNLLSAVFFYKCGGC